MTHVMWKSAQNPIHVAAKAVCLGSNRADIDWYSLVEAKKGWKDRSGACFSCLGRSDEICDC